MWLEVLFMFLFIHFNKQGKIRGVLSQTPGYLGILEKLEKEGEVHQINTF